MTYQFEPDASSRYPLDTRKSKGNTQRGTDGDNVTAAMARDADPQTAHDAAAAMTPRLGALHQRIRLAIQVSVTGLTTSEIATALCEPRDSISPRMKDLVKAGHVTDSGMTRIPPGHTRASIVWALAGDPHDAVLAALEGL